MMARIVMGALVVGALGGSPALAEGYAESIVRQLEAQGFSKIETEQTWLGRTRIVAEGSQGQREIIVNPNTGEILRDLWLAQNGGGVGGLISGSSSNDDGDDRDDGDDDSGDGNDDNGGNSGGSNSGGGNSGGGNGGDSGGGDDD
ncbi:MAG: hypothetical protein RLZZ563_1532 [Pseudomonadota bacterium]|jgi:hypothetical protein